MSHPLTVPGRRLRHLVAVSDVTPAEMAEALLARPTLRGQCEGGSRPCPFLGCRHHLALDTGPGGSIRLRFGEDPDLEKLRDTCALDVADRGAMTLEEVGERLGVTRERVRQEENKAMAKLKKRLAKVGIDSTRD